jgi:hypothetical protein
VKAARTGPNAFTLFSPAELTLRGPSGCEARVKGTVVAPLPDGVALSFEGDADALLATLLAAPAAPGAPAGMSDWDRLRGMSRTEKLVHAPRAERNERLVLVQDPDRPRRGDEHGSQAGCAEAAAGRRLSEGRAGRRDFQ